MSRTVKNALYCNVETCNIFPKIQCGTLDYCNSLLYGINDGLLRRLQLLQNAARRAHGPRSDHISPYRWVTALASSPSASRLQGPRARAPVDFAVGRKQTRIRSSSNDFRMLVE